MLVYMPVRVVGECNSLGGVISLDIDAVFRRTSLWGVVFNVPLVIK